jgi:UDP-N-acetylmuramate dehydrogenase
MNSLASILASFAELPDVAVLENEPLGPHTSMGVGGPARALAVFDQATSLATALHRLATANIPWMMLAGGSNTIFTEAGFSGVVVMLGRAFRQIEAGPGQHQLTAGAASNLSAVMNFSKRAGLSGFEWAAGVPGQIGGALAGNAGTPSGDMCSSVVTVDVLDHEFRPVTRARGEFDFSYRRSALRRDVILRTVLQLQPDDPQAIQARIDAGLKKRGEQPLGVRCSGCMFKNPADDFAGRLIDQAGLKGLRIGEAMVSTQHANFILNTGHATATDIMRLVEEVRQRVKASSGHELELEIRLVDPVHGPWAGH